MAIATSTGGETPDRCAIVASSRKSLFARGTATDTVHLYRLSANFPFTGLLIRRRAPPPPVALQRACRSAPSRARPAALPRRTSEPPLSRGGSRGDRQEDRPRK